MVVRLRAGCRRTRGAGRERGDDPRNERDAREPSPSTLLACRAMKPSSRRQPARGRWRPGSARPSPMRGTGPSHRRQSQPGRATRSRSSWRRDRDAVRRPGGPLRGRRRLPLAPSGGASAQTLRGVSSAQRSSASSSGSWPRKKARVVGAVASEPSPGRHRPAATPGAPSSPTRRPIVGPGHAGERTRIIRPESHRSCDFGHRSCDSGPLPAQALAPRFGHARRTTTFADRTDRRRRATATSATDRRPMR